MYKKFLFDKRKIVISRSDIETIPLAFALRSGYNGSGFYRLKNYRLEKYRKNKALKINNKIDIGNEEQKKKERFICAILREDTTPFEYRNDPKSLVCGGKSAGMHR